MYDDYDNGAKGEHKSASDSQNDTSEVTGGDRV
jgi:hypothetical protein